MMHPNKRKKNSQQPRSLITLALLGSVLLGANTLALAAVPTLFLEQSTSITGASDTLKASRVPVRNTAGAIKYYEIEFKFQLDATGRPVLAPFSPVVGLSPALLSGAFKAGKYKNSLGDVYTVTGPGVSTAGRTNWNIVLTKFVPACAGCVFEGFWTTGPIAGHPLQPVLTTKGITSRFAYSWGTTSTNTNHGPSAFFNCNDSRNVVGFAQLGNLLTLHGFCAAGSAVETNQMTLNLCTAANPC